MDVSHREVCLKCLRPTSVCYCDQLDRQDTRTHLVILQHPRERRVAVSTARMAHLSLPNSEMHWGVDFADDARVRELAAQPGTALLFPGPDARPPEELAPTLKTLVVVDGTWSQAKAIVRDNPALASLPRYSLSPEPTEYALRREPRQDYVCTLEAVAQALGILEGAPERFEALLLPLRRMVELQLEHRERRRGEMSRHAQRWAAQSEKAPRLPRMLVERAGNLVCAVAEANAWNARLPGAFPDELVHWLACRVATGERFESVVAPRNPLAPSTPVHTRLTELRLAQGAGPEELEAGWRGFLREADVLCTWGPYSASLAESSGLRLPSARIDLRKVAGDLFQRPPGTMEHCLSALVLEARPQGQGRGGERLGQLTAIARRLSEDAKRPRAPVYP